MHGAQAVHSAIKAVEMVPQLCHVSISVAPEVFSSRLKWWWCMLEDL